MSFAYSTSKGSLEQRWIVYALLRDNVQHHLEGGKPSSAFAALHEVGEALSGKKVTVAAAELHRELTLAKATLGGKPVADLAVSLRTRAVLGFAWPPPAERATTLVSEWGALSPCSDPRGLDDVFGHLIDGLLDLTRTLGDGAAVHVIDL